MASYSQKGIYTLFLPVGHWLSLGNRCATVICKSEGCRFKPITIIMNLTDQIINSVGTSSGSKEGIREMKIADLVLIMSLFICSTVQNSIATLPMP